MLFNFEDEWENAINTVPRKKRSTSEKRVFSFQSVVETDGAPIKNVQLKFSVSGVFVWWVIVRYGNCMVW